MPGSRIVELPPDAVARLTAAIAAVVPATADQFLAALELGYLVASADGLDPAERDALAGVLERAVGARFDHDDFTAHFADLDAAVATLGRRERLARAAADFATEPARADALRFAALVAMAEGALDAPELAVLAEAGALFAWSPERVRALVDETAAAVRGAR